MNPNSTNTSKRFVCCYNCYHIEEFTLVIESFDNHIAKCKLRIKIKNSNDWSKKQISAICLQKSNIGI